VTRLADLPDQLRAAAARSVPTIIEIVEEEIVAMQNP
jgi:hypothetical protein